MCHTAKLIYMIRHAVILLVTAAFFNAGCHTQQATNQTGTAEQANANTPKLTPHLSVASSTATSDSVMIIFTVANNTDKTQRFCKWETPFEPRLGKYFEVTDDKGNEAVFKGAMARRVMPPPQEAYIEVAPHDSVKAVINLANNYTLASGNYTVKYTGGGVSGLDAGNSLSITLAKP
jgi:hypothetical protein